MTEQPKAGPSLRAMLLAAKPSDLGLAPTAELPRVWAALMEMKMSGVVVTLAVVADGATSLYFSNGGGIIGGGGHESVRSANRKMLSFIETALDIFVPIQSPLDVLEGTVTFVVRTHDELRGARDHEASLRERRSAAWPAYYLGQDVISALRLATNGRTNG